MRNISFAMTTEQIRKRTKTVTRRVGWRWLQPGTELQAVVKSRGLRKGEKVEKLCVIRVKSVRLEPLSLLSDWPTTYGGDEVQKEGFATGPLSEPADFVDWFASSHKI